MRMGMPASPAASSTASVAARPPMLPGLMRSFAAPRRAASMAMTGVEVHVGHHGQRRRLTHRREGVQAGAAGNGHTHDLAAGLGQAASIWARLAATSSAGALSMDCIATGAPPPTGTLPTMTWRVRWLGRSLAPAASAETRLGSATAATAATAATSAGSAASAEARSVAATSAKALLVSADSVMASSAFAESGLRSDGKVAAYCTASARTPPRRAPTP